jgi:GT2 family glycosyltransferase
VSKTPPSLSIIILSYNVKQLLLDCLNSVFTNAKSDWQVIVVDNASSDGSAEAVESKFPKVIVVKSDTNLGFSAGNNLGLKKAVGDFVLFLNDDTLIKGNAIEESLNYLRDHADVGALTCRVELPNGKLDYSCHRGLPTPWNSLCYFSGLSKLFPRSRTFSGYTATYQDLNTVHEIDCATGAFMLVRRQAGNAIGWWDNDYFWNGEDIEFCYQLRKNNWKIVFYPLVKIVHFKGSSSGLWTSGQSTVSQEVKLKTAKSAARAMKIFYGKHFKKGLGGLTVWWGISMLEQIRLYKLKLGLKYA